MRKLYFIKPPSQTRGFLEIPLSDFNRERYHIGFRPEPYYLFDDFVVEELDTNNPEVCRKLAELLKRESDALNHEDEQMVPLLLWMCDFVIEHSQ